ncbi:HupE/UreJ family protein [Marinobacterium jannaschii]|uniref:HupE/UreJ family protein n=1 Tax=Marinobacterium jannaschii TaxID=64970 RepID=UPI000B02B4B8|nr:HupE/UreJ family protein [Marinobacterium jannaschii]
MAGFRQISYIAILSLAALPALAHDAAEKVGYVAPHGGGFMAGLSHPVLGFDHLLAMISVGVLSAQMGGRAIWQVPLTFVFLMLLGGVAGMQKVPLFSVELGIAISVLALGIAIAAESKFSALLAITFVGFFAIFHGHAHGTEMPYLAKPVLYALGFVAGTAAIHIAGVVIGLVSQRYQQGVAVLRYTGAAIAGIGFHLILMPVLG